MKPIFIVFVCILCVAGGAAVAINYTPLLNPNSDPGNLTNDGLPVPAETSSPNSLETSVLNPTQTSTSSGFSLTGSSSSASTSTPVPLATVLPEETDMIIGTWSGSRLVDFSPIMTVSTNYQAVFNEDNSGVATMTVNISDVSISGVDLSSVTLSDLSALSGVDLSNVTISDISALSGVDLSSVTISDLSALSGVDLSNVTISDLSALSGVDLSVTISAISSRFGIDLSGVDLSGVTLSDLSVMLGIDLSRVSLSDLSVMLGIDLSRVSLSDISVMLGVDLFNIPLSSFYGFALSGAEQPLSREFTWSYVDSNQYCGNYGSNVRIPLVINGDTLTMTINPYDMGLTGNSFLDMDLDVELEKV